MSKPGKVPSKLFHKAKSNEVRQIVEQRLPRTYYLIACEGTETEPNYFEAIRKKLPKEMVQRITIQGTARNTLSLVSKVEKIIEEHKKQGLPPFNKVWIVMDRDSFPAADFDNAIDKINVFDKKYKHSCNWNVAWSNEAFELWYLLHFTSQTGGQINRETYKSKLTKLLGHTYKKNDENIFNELQDKTLKAIKNAEQGLYLQERQNIPKHKMNPATTVHLLVSELCSYMDPPLLNLTNNKSLNSPKNGEKRSKKK